MSYSNPKTNNGWQDSAGYNHGSGLNAYGDEKSEVLGAGDTVWQPDRLANGYQENVHSSNFFDSPYTETYANSDGIEP